MASEYCKFPHCECSMGAAERARYVEASQRATNEESLKDTMHRGLLRWKERAEKAEADNAAKDARIKELEALYSGSKESHEKAYSAAQENMKTIKSLEAKLAAAETFIKLCADGVFVNDPSLRGAARSLMGGK